MATRLYIHPDNPQHRLIRQVADCLDDGGVIAYPTDTIYGLGCKIGHKHALERLFDIKGRSHKKPISILCANISQVSRYAIISNWAFQLIKHCLPGPYTFILPGTHQVPKTLLTKQRSIGIRIPDCPIACAITVALDSPITTTSANLSEQAPLDNANDIEAQFGNQLDLIIDSGPLPNLASTVVSLLDDRVEILREGAGSLTPFSNKTGSSLS